MTIQFRGTILGTIAGTILGTISGTEPRANNFVIIAVQGTKIKVVKFA